MADEKHKQQYVTWSCYNIPLFDLCMTQLLKLIDEQMIPAHTTLALLLKNAHHTIRILNQTWTNFGEKALKRDTVRFLFNILVKKTFNTKQLISNCRCLTAEMNLLHICLFLSIIKKILNKESNTDNETTHH